ncbi:cwf18 pre-mRNA splicing factor-like protein [Sarcoptes scabiei]|uniref:Cwf18 pre-mRNA splicing factor-like protein n=1 Tax=Sarcoptes scabiei TaxID=52283 RepID=A0A132A6F6_SARSC|nr:cwf18 pre-mRNA splicing factor-like protein [Sarcoptes scabiei]
MQYTENDYEIGQVENEAIKRQKRLKEMREKRNRLEKESKDKSESNENKNYLPKPKFRNYNPNDVVLKENLIPKAEPENVKNQIINELELGESNKTLVEDIDLTQLAPKKIDWDLKRNIASRLEKLEKKTLIVIADLISIINSKLLTISNFFYS